jgi:glycosyltransferase involved in cell wall biosynthesis
MTGAIAAILKGYPRLSETFIAQELLELERAGFRLHVIALRRPTDKARHPIHDEIGADISYLPEYLHEEPLRVLRAWWSCRRTAGYRRAFRTLMPDFRRDPTRNRLRRFGQALVLAHEMPEDVRWLYAHFIHTPASVAYYAHMITGLDWSCSAHAKDIWTSPDWELREKLDDARWTVTCTESGYHHLRAIAAPSSTVRLVHHGLDLNRFPPFHRQPSVRDGQDADDPVRLMTVGRAVEKKGLDTLVAALAGLPKTLNWRWTHIGGGVLSDKLRTQVQELGLTERVEMLGSKPQEFILQTYRDGDLFVLPCRIAKDGDRDGLPNVLVEAQSQGLVCISSPISGIVELIEDGVNGLLTPPDEADKLQQAIRSLIEDPTRRDRMGAAGAEKVRKNFNHLSEIRNIIDLFENEGILPDLAEAAQ